MLVPGQPSASGGGPSPPPPPPPALKIVQPPSIPESELEEERRYYASQIELEKRRAKEEFEKQLRAERERARQQAFKQFYSQIQKQKSELLAKLEIEERQALRAAPFNIRRLILKKYRQKRIKALELFSIQAEKAEEQFKLQLELELAEWEKIQRQQFQLNIQKWEEQKWTEIERELKTSIERALASVPEGMKIKEIEWTEKGWKIIYQKPKEQVISEIREKLGYSPGETVQIIPSGGSLAWGVRMVKQMPIEKAIELWLEKPEEIMLVPKGQRTPEEVLGVIDIATLGLGASFAPLSKTTITVSDIVLGGATGTVVAEISKYVSTGSHLTAEEILTSIRVGAVSAAALKPIFTPLEQKVLPWLKETEIYKQLVRKFKFSEAYKFYYEKFKVSIKAFYQTRIKLPAEKLVYKHILRRTPKGLAPQVVDIPEFVKPTAMNLWKQEAAWQIAESPKTSALLLTKYYRPTSKHVSAWVSEHWLKKATGGISYAIIKPQLETYIPVKERKIPYIPSLELKASQITTENIVASSTILSAFHIFGAKIKSKPIIKQESKVSKITTPKISTKTLSLSLKAPTLSLKTIKAEKTLQIPKPSIPKFEFKLPKPRGRKRKKPIGIYGWIGLEVPVPSAKQILKTIIGGRKK